MSQNDTNSEISIYNPDFYSQFCEKIIFDSEEREACIYLYKTKPNILNKFHVIKNDVDKYKEWLDSEETAIAKQYFTKWFNRVDRSRILSLINQVKTYNEQIKHLGWTLNNELYKNFCS